VFLVRARMRVAARKSSGDRRASKDLVECHRRGLTRPLRAVGYSKKAAIETLGQKRETQGKAR
jgi:hypothetical protein